MRLQVHEIVPSRRPGGSPPWHVVCLCDADGDPGVGLGLTVGLAGLDLPELLLPARPTHGAVPADPAWRLSHSELAAVLDDLGARLSAGTLWDGATAHPLAAGRAVAPLAPPPPVPVDALAEALPAVMPRLAALAPPAAAQGGTAVREVLRHARAGRDGAAPLAVAPVGWAVGADPAPGRAFAGGLPGAETATIRARTAALRGAILDRGGRPGHVPARWRPAGAGAAARVRRFGPRDPVVVARAEQVLVSDAVLLTAFVRLAVDLWDDTTADVLDALDGLGAVAGRAGVPAELEVAATDVMNLLTGLGGHAARWRTAWQSARPGLCRGRRASAEPLVLDVVRRHVLALLATEAFADVLPPASAIRGRLSWLGALDGRP